MPRSRSGSPGFTLIEVLIAMGIFLGAMMAILGIYFQNLKLARMAREEIIVSMIQRDIMARNQVVASARAGHERSYKRGVAGYESAPPLFDQFGSPRDGTDYGTAGGIGETTDPDQALRAGWGVRNLVTWEKVSGLHWGRYTPAQMTARVADLVAAGMAQADAQLKAELEQVPLYENFYFIAHPVWRYQDGTDTDGDGFPDYPWVRRAFEPASVAEWDPATTTGMRGLAQEDNQFTDWDGYGLVDMDNDGEPETDRGAPYPSPGPIHSLIPGGFPAGSDSYNNNPYRIFFLGDKMFHYYMKIRVRIMWQVMNEDEVFNLTDAMVKTREDAGKRVFNHVEYYFSVFNPDIVKRWQP